MTKPFVASKTVNGGGSGRSKRRRITREVKASPVVRVGGFPKHLALRIAQCFRLAFPLPQQIREG
jgi:hypothetical protein